MKITLDLTESEAIFIKDALIDKSLDLRTIANVNKSDVMLSESAFLESDASDRRKKHYMTLRDTSEQIRKQFKIF